MGLLLPDDSENDLRDMLRWWRSPDGQRMRSMESIDEQEPLQVKNTENNAIPAWGCMEVTGTTSQGELKLVTVKKPTSTGTLFLFNGRYEIEANGYGCAQTGPVYRVYKSSGTVTLGERWKPTSGQYYLTKAIEGPYVVYGSDDIGTDVFRVVEERRRIKHVQAPAGGVPAFNTGTLTMGSATCTEFTCNSSGVLTSGSSLTCYNAAAAVAANAYGMVAMNEAGLWVWIVERC